MYRLPLSSHALRPSVRRVHRGFTMVELLMVIAVIGILAAILLPNLLGATDTAKVVTTKTLISQLAPAMDEYRKVHPRSEYPKDNPTTGDTVTLVLELVDRGLYAFQDDNLSLQEPYEMVDAWLEPFQYFVWLGKSEQEKAEVRAHNKNGYDLESSGEDKDFATPEDNIANWARKLTEDKDD